MKPRLFQLMPICVIIIVVIIGSRQVPSDLHQGDGDLLHLYETGISDLPGDATWYKTFGSNGSDYFSSSWSDGSYIYSCGSTSIASANPDVLVVKWDLLGNQVWNRTWGGTGSDWGIDIHGDGEDVYVCGSTESFGLSHSELVLLRWDADGNRMWNYTLRDKGENMPTNQGTSVWCNSTDVFCSGTFDSINGVFSRWYRNGSLVWCNTSIGVYCNPCGITVAGPSIFSTGYYIDGGGKPEILLLKISVDGDLEWYNHWTVNDFAVGTGMCLNGSSIYIIGYLDMSNSKLIVMKTDDTGNQVWNVTRVRTSGRIEGRGIAVHGENVFTCSYYYSSLEIPPDGSTIMKWTVNGTLMWSHEWQTCAQSIIVNNQDIYVSGTTHGADQEGFLLKWGTNAYQPSANFSASNLRPVQSFSTTFSYTGFAGDGIASYEWDFGDGTANATTQNVSHVFSKTGLYNITLTVVDVDGDTSTITKDDYITVLPFSSDPVGDEWPMWRGALNHTGVSSTTILTQGTGPIWKFNTGGTLAWSPAIVNGRVYIGCENHKLYCFNATTGGLIWNITSYTAIDSAPAVAGDCVYVSCANSYTYCYNATTGAEIWAYGIGGSGSAAVSGGKVYLNLGGLTCLNASTGAYNWSIGAPSTPSCPAIANGKIYMFTADSVFRIVNISGSGGYSRPAGPTSSSPAVAYGRVFIGGLDGKLYCFNATDGIQIWNYTTGEHITSSPAVSAGRVYFGNTNGFVYSLDITTGALLWNYNTGGDIQGSSPAIVGDRLFIGSRGPVGSDLQYHGGLYCLNATTGVLLWNYTTNDQGQLSPSIARGRVYVGSTNGTLFCFPIIMLPSRPLSPLVNNSDSEILLHWQMPLFTGGSPIMNFTIYRGASPASVSLLTTIGTDTNFTDTGLTNGQAYYYKVSAVTAAGEGPLSVAVMGTPRTIPGEPRNLQASPGNTQIMLIWQSPSFDGGALITGYRIYQDGAPITTLGAVTSHTVTSLTNGQQYSYYITALNAAGEGNATGEVSATPRTTPSVPRTLSATFGNTNITLTWLVPLNNGGSPITGYRIYRGLSIGTETLLTTIGNLTTFTDISLTNGVRFYYRVAAVNGAGTGTQTSSVGCTPMTFPTAPRNLRASMEDDHVRLQWDAPLTDGGDAIDGYVIYRNGSLFQHVGLLTSYLDMSAAIGYSYNYTIRAENAVGEGTPSSVVSIYLAEQPPTSDPVTMIVVMSIGVVLAMIALTFSISRRKGKERLTKKRLVPATDRFDQKTAPPAKIRLGPGPAPATMPAIVPYKTLAKSPKPPSPVTKVPVQQYDRRLGATQQPEGKFEARINAIAKVSESLTIEQLAAALGVDVSFVWQNVFSWADHFGFKVVDGRVIFKGADITGLADELDRHFKEWESKEKSGEGKR